MNTYAFIIKAKAKSDKKSLFCWFSAKSDSRAEREILNILDDAEIETGRGADYLLPVRTNWHVVDDLPEEGVIDDTWCDRYELGEDGLTWQQIPTPPQSVNIHDDRATVAAAQVEHPGAQLAQDTEQTGTQPAAQQPSAVTFEQATFTQRVLGAWLYSEFTALGPQGLRDIAALQHDMDATYPQNLLLALNNARELLQLKHCFPKTFFDLIRDIKTVWPADGKAPDVGHLLAFGKEWIHAHNNSSASDGPRRDDITAKWFAKQGMKRTDAGTNAGGNNVTDRSPDYTHSLDTLDIEIALATLPMDFDIYEIPVSLHRRAKEIVAGKEKSFKAWSQKLRAMPGILDYSRAAIFALIRGASADITHFPDSMQRYINTNLTESDHTSPTPETLRLARQVNSASVVLSELDKARTGESLGSGVTLSTEFRGVGDALVKEIKNSQQEPEFTNLGNGMFSIDGLPEPTPTAGALPDGVSDTDPTPAADLEGTGDVQMETTDSKPLETATAVPDAASNDITIEEASAGLASAIKRWADAIPPKNEPEPDIAAVEDSSEPTPEYPACFEPGRYEGLPNNVYHAANGISSTQVKDARVSLMYFNARHVAKTIVRESSDALTFGSLVHTLALEPEKLEEEFAIFPGTPAGAFTNTDSLKSWIREYNADKPKAEQLKLTGKKEDLQESIRAVFADAVFADEFETQWRAGVGGKTILSAEQLAAAGAIQQALLSHPTASGLLRNPSRSVEVSYFGMDEETGLEVRVRPDLELEADGLRIAVDLKTISVGNVKQDGLRARLHREIVDRDYHLSAAMYAEVADFDRFFWVFVNKDPGYNWVAIIEASPDVLELGSLEYHRTMRALAGAYDTDTWPAPITDDYADELNDFDLRRLEALRAQA
ncbi:RecE family exodeoxyribonuclease [Dickeya solani]|uniref:RecE family exodeoxyribonuclease n=1 Tax=Dickeya solani TaxID=1089444 RepID=A0ABU4EKQ0_9GAMM|nr:RecE family exodeoxyribonuclease [Dickeya solani]MCA6998177.1 PD-(D/E)XK nuclease-like domain-containing protein [Dickeya solani]MCA6999528.1 PD-(D/E)XK nuclease-like domain-containing protein [Dickeya solani]MCZ0823798.1 PD-(D/E)XK nuclease-like domain-containing protein [Dickeya solani]MDV6997683.1 RecE family exodeoxyribonuclease [Dickeya solani]MDV7006472.1 RecE family exodeoxyribonuclease [Dickeya solani]